MLATLSIGSNLGDREKNIGEAVALLSEKLGPVVDMTKVIETEAVGFDGNRFLNALVQFDAGLSPEELLLVCKQTERRLGRTDKPEYDGGGNRIYHDRTMDVDILFYGKLEMDTPELTIPHPQVKTRPFIKELLLLLHDF